MKLFNPYTLLAIVAAIAGSFAGGYFKGSTDTARKYEAQALKAEKDINEKRNQIANNPASRDELIKRLRDGTY